jgi:multiple sugar transport system substrate-binding protein
MVLVNSIISLYNSTVVSLVCGREKLFMAQNPVPAPAALQPPTQTANSPVSPVAPSLPRENSTTIGGKPVSPIAPVKPSEPVAPVVASQPAPITPVVPTSPPAPKIVEAKINPKPDVKEVKIESKSEPKKVESIPFVPLSQRKADSSQPTPAKPMTPVSPAPRVNPVASVATSAPAPVPAVAKPPQQPVQPPRPMPQPTQSPSPLTKVSPVGAAPTLQAAPAPAKPIAAVKPLSPAPSSSNVPPSPPKPANTPASPVPPTPTNPNSQNPKLAEIRQSPLRFLPFIVGGLLLLIIGFFIFNRFFGGNKDGNTPQTPGTTGKTGSSVTLTYWGLWETTPVMQEVIDDFEQSHPGIKVNYQQQSYRDYRERLQTAVVGGRGPDIFRFHASWVPMLQQELSPMPASVYSPTEFEQTFYPVATEQLNSGGQLVGVPLMYDGLALYYNEEMLKTANAQPPTTWAELKKLASQLTIRTGSRIQRGGIALGNSTNVEHFSDILGLLMLQNGADPTNPTSTAAQDALIFYTNFIKEDGVWDSTLPSSTIAFARGDAAMMIAPSWRVHEIQALNPNLKFSIAPVPQLTSTKVTWGTYWAEGVNAQSKYKNESWTFLKYLSSAEVLKKFQSSASKTRAFGEIYSRRDLAGEMGSPQFTSAYLLDAPTAKNWYLNSFTHDNGLNDLLIKYYEDAVTATVQGGDPANVLQTVSQGTDQILRQYGISTSANSQ